MSHFMLRFQLRAIYIVLQLFVFFFFFQAEDGIRDKLVTGVQTCALPISDGEKQAAILKAEGDRQARILNAEGARQAAILRAEGFSLALSKIFEVAKGVDAKTMSLQYLDALKTLGNSPATKFVLPLELTSLLSGVIGDSRKAFTSAKS